MINRGHDSLRYARRVSLVVLALGLLTQGLQTLIGKKTVTRNWLERIMQRLAAVIFCAPGNVDLRHSLPVKTLTEVIEALQLDSTVLIFEELLGNAHTHALLNFTRRGSATATARRLRQTDDLMCSQITEIDLSELIEALIG